MEKAVFSNDAIRYKLGLPGMATTFFDGNDAVAQVIIVFCH